MPPVAPMLARSVPSVPPAEAVPGGLQYEPKWDGFRCVVFRDGDEVVLGSRNERPLTRYFPEVVDAVRAQLPPRCVVDGEVLAAVDGKLDFDTLLNRIHPAASRVEMLARTTPASLVVFDLLALGDDDVRAWPQRGRWAALREAMAGSQPPVYCTPATTDEATARQWFTDFEGAGLDGVVAKARELPYVEDARQMLKVKHARTADCVLAGYRWHKNDRVVGSLLLGLYDDTGTLQHVGVAASFPMARRRELVDELAGLVVSDPDTHPWSWAGSAPSADGDRRPGATSRWNAGKDLSFVPLRPERVVEVGYDHMEGRRFRHTTQFKRWRPDREPDSCTYAQLQTPLTMDLAAVLAAG